MMPKKLTLEQVMEVEAHGLSIGKSAFLLDVAVTTLARFIRDNRIVWRGKKRFGYNPYSNNQLILSTLNNVHFFSLTPATRSIRFNCGLVFLSTSIAYSWVMFGFCCKKTAYCFVVIFAPLV